MGSLLHFPHYQLYLRVQQAKSRAKWVTLARISRGILLIWDGIAPIIGRPAPIVRESPDRVKWDYRGQRKIIPLGWPIPKIAVDTYVAPNVVLACRVAVHDGASVWNSSDLRGDLNKITVDFCSNVQERCVVHAAWSSPTGTT